MICSSDFKYTSSKYKVYFECTTMLTSITFSGIQENNLIIFYIDVGLRVVHGLSLIHATDFLRFFPISVILNMPIWNDHSLWIYVLSFQFNQQCYRSQTSFLPSRKLQSRLKIGILTHIYLFIIILQLSTRDLSECGFHASLCVSGINLRFRTTPH